MKNVGWTRKEKDGYENERKNVWWTRNEGHENQRKNVGWARKEKDG